MGVVDEVEWDYEYEEQYDDITRHEQEQEHNRRKAAEARDAQKFWQQHEHTAPWPNHTPHFRVLPHYNPTPRGGKSKS